MTVALRSGGDTESHHFYPFSRNASHEAIRPWLDALNKYISRQNRLAPRHRLLEEEPAYVQRAAEIGASVLIARHPAIEPIEKSG